MKQFQFILILSILNVLIERHECNYQVGFGIADVTGPPLGVAFLGYGSFGQKGHGIHLRQFARTFLICDSDKHRNCSIVVTVDVCMITSYLRQKVLNSIRSKFDARFNEDNTALIATHTHSTPGGYNGYDLYNIPNLGFNKIVFSILHKGIIQSIENAYRNLQSGHLYFNYGKLMNANINRSPAAYLLNPENERKRFEHNVDKDMFQLKITNRNGKLIGLLNWFAVHGTSMNNTNQFISSDNFGCASIELEKLYNQQIGKNGFVAAFLPSNLGDVSPNTDGAKCLHGSNQNCDPITSKCVEKNNEFCYAKGPGRNMFESTRTICELLAEKAQDLSKEKGVEITGDIKFVHRFIDVPKVSLVNSNDKNRNVANQTTVSNCSPALGYAFAAGTTDGPGLSSFSQGTLQPSFVWNVIGNVISDKPTEDEIDCHVPKPILLNGKHSQNSNRFLPSITSIQVIQIGIVNLVFVPGELTTMAGRRLRHTLYETAPNSIILITSLSNDYINYITTKEEYQLQRYEGGATLFGPNELAIFQKLYTNLILHLDNGRELAPSSAPPNFDHVTETISLKFDLVVLKKIECRLQPKSVYKIGETVRVSFETYSPNINVLHEDSYFYVERKINQTTWSVVMTDADWYSRIGWSYKWFYYEATIEIELNRLAFKTGVYRITYNGKSQKSSTDTSDSASLPIVLRNCSTNNFEIVP